MMLGQEPSCGSVGKLEYSLALVAESVLLRSSHFPIAGFQDNLPIIEVVTDSVACENLASDYL